MTMDPARPLSVGAAAEEQLAESSHDDLHVEYMFAECRSVFTGHVGGGVTLDDNQLDPRLDVRRYFHDGYAWGYEGGGPAQLALAILLAVTGREEAEASCQRFEREVVARFPQGESWTLAAVDVRRWLARTSE